MRLLLWSPGSAEKSDVRAVVSAKEVLTESIMGFQGGEKIGIHRATRLVLQVQFCICTLPMFLENLSGPLKSENLILSFFRWFHFSEILCSNKQLGYNLVCDVTKGHWHL